MKLSELKNIIKECVRDVIREELNTQSQQITTQKHSAITQNHPNLRQKTIPNNLKDTSIRFGKKSINELLQDTANRMMDPGSVINTMNVNEQFLTKSGEHSGFSPPPYSSEFSPTIVHDHPLAMLPLDSIIDSDIEDPVTSKLPKFEDFVRK